MENKKKTKPLDHNGFTKYLQKEEFIISKLRKARNCYR